MSAERNRKYAIETTSGHHFVETAREAGLGRQMIDQVLRDVLERAGEAPDRALAAMPARLRLLEAGLASL